MKCVEDRKTNGAQNYVGGMACCCGVGEAGLNVMNGGGAETNRIYLARADEEGWVVENQVSHDCGAVMLVEYGD